MGLTAALMVWLSTWTGSDSPGGGPVLLFAVLVEGIWPAALWLLAAAGFGFGLCRILRAERFLPIPVRISLGVAVLLWLDHALGALGLLTAGGTVATWVLTLTGGALLAITWVRRSTDDESPKLAKRAHSHWWVASPALAVLLVAACSAPGWLWGTEFGGFDALSYHLQLPKEWLATGQVSPLEHNVYSYLPSYVETAYLHLIALRGDAIMAAVSCQLLHALITILLAATVADLIGVMTCRKLRPIGWAFTLGTSWSVVVGSLAYNEMFAALMLAAGVRIVLSDDRSAARTGALLGLLAGAACGAKLTAVGFVALPLGAIALFSRSHRTWPVMAGTGIAIGTIMLAPWLVRNGAASGNPFFPFLTELFGTAHWTPEQASRWSAAHSAPSSSVLDRLLALWRQVFSFGLGSNPQPGEPWAAQWSVLPWLALLGLVIATVRNSATRMRTLSIAVGLALAVLFWLGFTHLQSRFLTPALPLLVIAAALGLACAVCGKDDADAAPWRHRLVLAIALLYACQPVLQFARERSIEGPLGQPAAAIGTESLYTGDGYSTPMQQQLAASGFASVAVNHLLPPDARVLLAGEARPFYFALDRTRYATVWDSSPLEEIAREWPDDPARWPGALRERGFTHILLNAAMLRRWRLTDHLDPAIDPDAWFRALSDHAQLLTSFGADMYLFELAPAR